MRKKILIATGAFFVFILLLAVVAVVMGGGQEQVQPVAPAPAPVADEQRWAEYYEGTDGTHVYNALFDNTVGESLEIEEAVFTNVQYPVSGVEVKVKVENNTQTTTLPLWARNMSLAYVESGGTVIRIATERDLREDAQGAWSIALSSSPKSGKIAMQKNTGSSVPSANEQPPGLYLLASSFYGKKSKSDLLVGITAPAPPPGLSFGSKPFADSPGEAKNKKKQGKKKKQSKKNKVKSSKKKG